MCIFCYIWLIFVSLWFLGWYNASDWFRGSSAIVSGCAKWNQGFGRCLFLLVLEFPNCSSPPYYEEFYFCSCLPSEVVLDLVKLGWNNIFLLNWWASYKSLFAMCHSCHQWVALQRVLTPVPCPGSCWRSSLAIWWCWAFQHLSTEYVTSGTSNSCNVSS